MSSQLAVDPTSPSDAELIALVRGGDSHAYGQLFERHRGAALRLARGLGPAADADDLVSDAFLKVHRVITDGRGPDVSFRPYLLTAVRRLHIDRLRATSRVTPSDEIEKFDPGVPFADPAVAAFENSAAATAFASLPERWQMVLWHLEVEGQRPADIAPLLGMSANSVSALAYRAREGLRQAYLQNHLADTGDETCRWVTERLGAHVRGGLAKREAAKVDEHLDECPRCAAVYLELTEVNSNLKGLIAPLLLGAAATGYLASSGGTAGAGFLGLWWLRAKDVVSGNAGVSASVAATAVVVAGVTGAMIVQGPDNGRAPVSGVVVSSPPTSGDDFPGGDEPGSDDPGSDDPGSDDPGSDDPGNNDPGGPLAGPPGGPPPFPFAPVLPFDGPAGRIGPALSPPGSATTAAPTSPPGESPTAPGATTTDSTSPSPSGGPTSDPTQPGTTTPPTDSTPTETTPTETTPTETTPTETTPTETTPTETTPTPPKADLSLVLDGTRHGPVQVDLVATIGGVPDGVTPTVSLVFTLTSSPEFSSSGWDCRRTDAAGDLRRVYECTQLDAANDNLKFDVNLLDFISLVTARVDADVDDPNPDNNADRYPRR